MWGELDSKDLVAWMLKLALGEKPPLDAPLDGPSGHSVEARVYAEDPNKDFRPCAGLLTKVAQVAASEFNVDLAVCI